MKDDYFVMFKKKEDITLVFNALMCKYELYAYKCTYKGRECYAHLFGWFVLCMCLYVVNDNLSRAVLCNV